MATEKKRGCGYRKINGLYLVGDGMTVGCDRLPHILDVCPTCNQGIKFTQGFTWIKGAAFFKENCNGVGAECHVYNCKICNSNSLGKVGLMWVGQRFYSPKTFVEEAKNMGVSKRISHVPKGLEIGDFVMLAHKQGGTVTIDNEQKKVPAIFYGFHVTRIEQIITETMSKDKELMESLDKRKITPVIVPDNDPDHTGTVYDDQKKQKTLVEAS